MQTRRSRRLAAQAADVISKGDEENVQLRSNAPGSDDKMCRKEKLEEWRRNRKGRSSKRKASGDVNSSFTSMSSSSSSALLLSPTPVDIDGEKYYDATPLKKQKTCEKCAEYESEIALLQETCDAAAMKASELERDVAESKLKIKEEKSEHSRTVKNLETKLRQREKALKTAKGEAKAAQEAEKKIEKEHAKAKADLEASKQAGKPNEALEHALRAQQTARKALAERAAFLEKKLKDVRLLVDGKKKEEADALKAAQAVAEERAAALERANSTVSAQEEQLKTLQKSSSEQKQLLEKSRMEITCLAEKNQAAQTKLDALAQQLRQAQEALIRAEEVRRNMHEEVMTLKGNIRVFVRMRPRFNAVRDDQVVPTFSMPDGDVGGDHRMLIVHDVPQKSVDGLSEKCKKWRFGFDRVFGEKTSQEDMFAEIKGLVHSAIDGKNVCIFAYGQTGSGKTHTMTGSSLLPGEKIDTSKALPADAGLIPRSVVHVFNTTKSFGVSDWTFQLSASFLEIYNENIRDLLSPSKKKLDIKHNPRTMKTQVEGLTRIPVTTADEVLDLIKRASDARSVAATKCNAQSSRSHSVFTLHIDAEHKSGDSEKKRSSELHMIDLAGSERLSSSGSGANPKLLAEAQAINTSLSALSNTIRALATKSAHVPFRDSKLTYLLRNSLGGDAKTMMICNVSPESLNETVCSLRFAEKVNKCTTNPGDTK